MRPFVIVNYFLRNWNYAGYLAARVARTASPKLDHMSEAQRLSVAADYALQGAKQALQGMRALVLTGAGISTDSGIPDYRGAGRTPKHPLTFDSFMGSRESQVRYWARSFVGWSRIADAVPNPGHIALADAEATGRVLHVVTQNVDALHQAAGSKNVIDLHGRLDRVRCMSCSQIISRAEMDIILTRLNPGVSKDDEFEFTPDGDAEIEAYDGFMIPDCAACGGVLKPDVVFFGEQVPAVTATFAMEQLGRADALVVAGSSLTVNSGLRFVKQAARLGKPIVIVNLGVTKGDQYALAKVEASTSLVLPELFGA